MSLLQLKLWPQRCPLRNSCPRSVTIGKDVLKRKIVKKVNTAIFSLLAFAVPSMCYHSIEHPASVDSAAAAAAAANRTFPVCVEPAGQQNERHRCPK